MREQAKKMNVESLRSGQQSDTSAEAKLAKVSLLFLTFVKMNIDLRFLMIIIIHRSL